MISDPLVSIIIPVYNAEKYIESCIDSVLSQTYKNIEILILDDGSTDLSLYKLKKYIDNRITLITRENRGLAKTLIELASLSNGAFIARMDADDVCNKKRIEKQINKFLCNDKLVLVGSNVDYISNKSDYLGSSISVCSHFAISKKLSYGNVIFHPTVMFKKSAYFSAGGYSPLYEKYIEDFLLWIKLKNFGEISVIPESLVHYRV
ncbi:MAG: glycosyltransferase involved in cell wall biosynthesis, partial [Arcobacteraceae bacterium]